MESITGLVRRDQVLNLKGELIELTIVGALVRYVQPVRALEVMPRREYERYERACVDCPPIA